MAEQKKPGAKTQAQIKPSSKVSPAKPQKKSNILKLILIGFLLMIILGAGFAAGVYLNIIDIQKIAQTYKLHEYPVLNKYFPPPQTTNFETIPLDQELPTLQPPAVNTPSAPVTAPLPAVDKQAAEKAELEKQIKLRQIEEAKKITKLARLYGAMKPDEAVSIMNQLDDETVLAIFSRMEDEQVAKILALFEAKRAASLTQDMLKIKPIPSSNTTN